MKNALAIAALVAVILIAAIFGYRAAFSSAPKGVNVMLTADDARAVAKTGMDYLSQLRDEGRLPGITTNEHGTAYMTGRLSNPPYSLTAHFNKTGDAFTNNYAVVQMKKDSPWQLKRAWETDSDGQIIEEWPVR